MVEKIRSWFDLNATSTRSCMFTPKSYGGLGIPRPRVLYYSSRLSFILSVLNSSDRCVRDVARESLHLHMSKRKVPIAAPGEPNFAEYSVVGNKLNKQSASNWPKSMWVNLFDMCKREGISLRLRGDTYAYETVDDSEVFFTIESPQGFKFFYKQKCNSETLGYWTGLESQGRYVREAKDIDVKLSGHVFENHKIDDKIRNFILKCRLQLLPCQSLLALYYPLVHNKKCQNCNFFSETASHVLNGCTRFKSMYQKRHNRVVDFIHTKIAHVNSNCDTHKDKVLKPSMFNSDVHSFLHTHTRPDIVVINHEDKSVKIIEISVPYDCHISLTYQEKFNKYFPLSQEINELGYYTEIIVLLIGSMGSVHSKFVGGLRKCKITKREAKFLARYCSVSTCIGSFRVWRQRCSYLDG